MLLALTEGGPETSELRMSGRWSAWLHRFRTREGKSLLSPVEQALRLERGRAANLLLKRACETRDPAQGETNGAAMASGARNRRGQDDARMCVLTRGTGARRGAKDPGAKTPWWAAIHQSRQLHCPEPGKNDRSGAREDAHRQRKLARNYTTAHPTRPAPSCR